MSKLAFLATVYYSALMRVFSTKSPKADLDASVLLNSAIAKSSCFYIKE